MLYPAGGPGSADILCSSTVPRPARPFHAEWRPRSAHRPLLLSGVELCGLLPSRPWTLPGGGGPGQPRNLAFRPDAAAPEHPACGMWLGAGYMYLCVRRCLTNYDPECALNVEGRDIGRILAPDALALCAGRPCACQSCRRRPALASCGFSTADCSWVILAEGRVPAASMPKRCIRMPGPSSDGHVTWPAINDRSRPALVWLSLAQELGVVHRRWEAATVRNTHWRHHLTGAGHLLPPILVHHWVQAHLEATLPQPIATVRIARELQYGPGPRVWILFASQRAAGECGSPAAAAGLLPPGRSQLGRCRAVLASPLAGRRPAAAQAKPARQGQASVGRSVLRTQRWDTPWQSRAAAASRPKPASLEVECYTLVSSAWGTTSTRKSNTSTVLRAAAMSSFCKVRRLFSSAWFQLRSVSSKMNISQAFAKSAGASEEIIWCSSATTENAPGV
eukprot:scaffold4404_cov383-Prasinococcus_capsulatus_cf.AAC.3